MKKNENSIGARLFAAFLAGVMILGSVAAALMYIFN